MWLQVGMPRVWRPQILLMSCPTTVAVRRQMALLGPPKISNAPVEGMVLSCATVMRSISSGKPAWRLHGIDTELQQAAAGAGNGQ